MIARFVTVSALYLGLTACAFAQQSASVPAGAPANLTGVAETAALAAPAEGVATPAAGPVDAPAAAAVETEPVDPRAYRIGPEDVLDFMVWKNADLSRERIPVRPDGKVSLPLVNDIHVAGLTINEVRALIAERLAPYIQNPEVSVMVREVHSFKVSVQGNVRMPGQYEIKSEATVLDMVARAQGFNEFADKGGIWVIRRTGGREQRIEFKYNDAIRGREGANFFVQPGDIIHVN